MHFERGHFDHTSVNESFISEALMEIRGFASGAPTAAEPTVFLSHKHDDLRDLRGFIGMLQQLGAKVYIDSIDNRMPDQPCGETAMRIKEVIRHCNKFILLATPGTIESYWCNWELGIGDTYKYSDHIAILPIKDAGMTDREFKGNEYLQIYPVISYERGTSGGTDGEEIAEGYYVKSPGKEHIRVPLGKWLRDK